MNLTFEHLPSQVEKLSSEISEIKSLLLLKDSKQKSDRLLNVKECAKLLNVSVPTLYSYTQNNKIPYNKKGKRLLFLKSEIMDWVKTGRNKTVTELESETDEYLSNIKKG